MTPEGNKDRRPPVRFESPDGARYWTTERPLSLEDLSEEPIRVQGTAIRFFAEIGGGLPLWDESGRLVADPAWLEEHLGLDAELIADLIAWGDASDDPRHWGASAQAEWKREGHRLVQAVRACLPESLELVDGRHDNEK